MREEEESCKETHLCELLGVVFPRVGQLLC